jgi:hypothetical protein
LRQETAVCSHLNIDGHPFPVNFRIMKTLLAILLSFIISEAPVLAIHGGYTLGSSQSAVGTYAGVLIPTSDQILAANAADIGSNALGLFTLSIPDTGLGSGSIVVFSDGRTFTGSIQALADPNNPGGIVGIATASFTYDLYETLSGTAGDTVSTLPVTAQAQGSFNASTTSSDINSISPTGIDLDGTSTLNIDQGFVSGSNGTPIIVETVTFAVDGFQQSAVATTTTGT